MILSQKIGTFNATNVTHLVAQCGPVVDDAVNVRRDVQAVLGGEGELESKF
jgi:hypothetical protein